MFTLLNRNLEINICSSIGTQKAASELYEISCTPLVCSRTGKNQQFWNSFDIIKGKLVIAVKKCKCLGIDQKSNIKKSRLFIVNDSG